MYAVNATIAIRGPVWSTVRQVPTFYLDETVQGITNDNDALVIAHTILRAALPVDDDTVTIHADVARI